LLFYGKLRREVTRVAKRIISYPQTLSSFIRYRFIRERILFFKTLGEDFKKSLSSQISLNKLAYLANKHHLLNYFSAYSTLKLNL